MNNKRRRRCHGRRHHRLHHINVAAIQFNGTHNSRPKKKNMNNIIDRSKHPLSFQNIQIDILIRKYKRQNKPLVCFRCGQSAFNSTSCHYHQNGATLPWSLNFGLGSLITSITCDFIVTSSKQ